MKLELNNGHIFTYQTPATLNQAAPVQNTWYTILDTTANTLIYEITVNVEDTDETLECQITIDGETIQAEATAATHSTNYSGRIWGDAINRVDKFTLFSQGSSFKQYKDNQVVYGKSVKVEVRKTTAAGAGNLTGIVIYGVLEAI